MESGAETIDGYTGHDTNSSSSSTMDESREWCHLRVAPISTSLTPRRAPFPWAQRSSSAYRSALALLLLPDPVVISDCLALVLLHVSSGRSKKGDG